MNNSRQPNAALSVIRVVVITVLATLFAFVGSLFLSIVGIVLVNMFYGGAINMAVAYRRIALPIAIAALVIAFVVAIIYEVRHLRRSREDSGFRHAA